MQKEQSNGESPVPEAKNAVAEKWGWGWVIPWSYVLTLTLYALAGGPPYQPHLFAIGTMFCALYIYVTRGPTEKKAITLVMVIYLLLMAIGMAFPRPDMQMPRNLVIPTWITYKLLYVFLIGYFLAPIVEDLITNKRTQTRAIYIALSALFLLVLFIFFDKAAESHAAVICETIDLAKNMCIPKAEAKPWYTVSTVVEDLFFAFVATLLVAAFKFSEKKNRKTDASGAQTNNLVN